MINLKIVHSIKKDLGMGETGFLKQGALSETKKIHDKNLFFR